VHGILHADGPAGAGAANVVALTIDRPPVLALTGILRAGNRSWTLSEWVLPGGRPRAVLGRLVAGGCPVGRSGLARLMGLPSGLAVPWFPVSLPGQASGRWHGPHGGVGSSLLPVLWPGRVTPFPSPCSLPERASADDHRRGVVGGDCRRELLPQTPTGRNGTSSRSPPPRLPGSTDSPTSTAPSPIAGPGTPLEVQHGATGNLRETRTGSPSSTGLRRWSLNWPNSGPMATPVGKDDGDPATAPPGPRCRLRPSLPTVSRPGPPVVSRAGPPVVSRPGPPTASRPRTAWCSATGPCWERGTCSGWGWMTAAGSRDRAWPCRAWWRSAAAPPYPSAAVRRYRCPGSR
jgi:hypothetical protein